MKRSIFRVRYLVVLVSLLLVLQSFWVSPLVSQPRSSASAQGADPTVSLSPQNSTVPICENFTVNVTCSSVQDLYSWKFDMSFNSTCMECLDFEEGPFLSPGGTTHFVPPVIDNTAGTISGANCSLVPPSSGVSGDGTLANATFQCKNVVGQSTLYVNNIELYNSTSAEIYSGTCSGMVNQIPTVTFRLLAVEKTYTNGTYQFPMRSAEYLIQSLTSFKNWQNVTWGDYNYRSYIHLLSSVSTAELSQRKTVLGSNMLQYYKGVATKTSILNEITTFLNDTSPGESNDLTVRIFYYCGHGDSCTGYLTTDDLLKNITHTYHYLDLGSESINGTELDQALNTGDLGSSNCTLVILDTCTSGGFITDECNATDGIGNLTRLGRVILTATNENQLARGWIGSVTDSSPPTQFGNWSWFTGNENANYDNATYGSFGPLGIIGGLFNANDTNSDGWRSAAEVFDYAWNTTIDYSESWGNAWTDDWWSCGTHYSVYRTHPMFPDSWYGVAGGDIPLVMWYSGSDPTVSFCYNGAAQWPPTVFPLGPIDWPMFGHDAGHGRVSGSFGATVPNPVWTCSTLSAASSAAVVDGTVFLGAVGGPGVPSSISAVALATGRVTWTFSASGAIYSSPAVVDGMVFIGTVGGGGGGGGWLYALDEYTGRVRWEFEAPNGLGIVSSPAVTDGRVFIATMQQSSTTPCAVYALNETSGASIWNFTTTTPVESSPTCANGRVFVGTLDGTIYALNASTTNPAGQQLWNYHLSGNEIISTAAADSGSIYIGTIQLGGGGGGKVYAFNQFTGGSGPPEWQFPSTGSAPGAFSGSPAVDTDKNLVLIGSDIGEVYALSRTSGSPVWSTPVGPINMSSVAISKDGLVYIGSTNGNLYCLNETNGVPFWSYSVGGSIIASPALTYQHVIISSTGTNGTVQCIGPPFPVHDTAIYNLTALPNTVTPGKTININCTVVNNGNVNETSQVTYLYNNTAISNVDPIPLYAENVTLLPGTNTTITFTWDTTDLAPGSYTIIAHANPVPGEINVADNTLFDGTVQLRAHAALVVRGQDNRIYYRIYSSSTASWGGWNSLPTGTTMDSPAAAVCFDTLYVVVRGSDGTSLWFSSVNLTDSSFSGWTLLGGSTPSAPTLSSNGTALALTVRGEDNRIYYRLYTVATQTWTGWSVLPSGTTLDSPAASLMGNGLYIIVRGMDGSTLWYSNVNQGTGVFSGWMLWSGSTPSTPTLTTNGATLTLVVRGSDNRIYYHPWTGWSVLPSGTTQDSPAATILQNTIYIVVRGSDGNSLWQSSINLGTSTFSGWTLLSGSTPSKPTLTS